MQRFPAGLQVSFHTSHLFSPPRSGFMEAKEFSRNYR